MNEADMQAIALLVSQAVWIKAPSNEDGIIFFANLASQDLSLHLNDFPNEQLFTLASGGKQLLSFDDWPDQFGVKPWLDNLRIT